MRLRPFSMTTRMATVTPSEALQHILTLVKASAELKDDTQRKVSLRGRWQREGFISFQYFYRDCELPPFLQSRVYADFRASCDEAVSNKGHGRCPPSKALLS
jgi:hypothetical protein